MVLVIALSVPAPGLGAPPAGGPGAPVELEIRPGGGQQPTGNPQTVEARVALPNNDGVDGVVVDFELTGGPGDDDIGSAGHTPELPDMSCTTAGGGNNRAATCTVEYVEQDNEGGSDAVLAWIDADALDATVEADLGEGENQNAPGTGGCGADTKGPGLNAEPDQTDCVEKRWQARVAAAVDIETETGSALVGSVASFDATVFDQFGDLFAGIGRTTSVSVELLSGSVHDPGDGDDFGSPDLGSCDTGTVGRCAIAFGSSRVGVDSPCGYVPGGSASCAEAIGAPELDNGADVVARTWEADVMTAPSPAPPETPPPAVVTAPAKPEARPDARDDKPATDGDGKSGESDPSPTPVGDPSPPQESSGGVPPAAAPIADRKSVGARDAGTRADPSSSRRHRTARAPVRRRADSAGRTAPAERVRGRARSESEGPGGRVGRRLEQLSQVAIKTAERFSFPLGLAFFVVLFMAVQGGIDRRDPKLRLAPLDSKHDLASFA